MYDWGYFFSAIAQILIVVAVATVVVVFGCLMYITIKSTFTDRGKK